MKKLVWLASYPKSGNTWARAVLAAYLTDASGPFNLRSMYDFTSSESLVFDYVAMSGKPREQLDDAAIDAHREKVQQSLSERQDGPAWVKTHNANIVHNEHRLICPEFTRAAVYIVRNPLDIIDSLADHSNLTLNMAIDLLNDTKHALWHPDSHLVTQYLGTWSEHVRSWMGEGEFPTFLLRYEDMHADAIGSFSRLIQFLGWPWDVERMRRALDRTAFSRLKEVEQERGFDEANPSSRSGYFFRRGQCGAWQTTLSPKQAERILANHNETMQSVGYQLLT